MPDIKTRDVVSGTIKAVDRSAMAGQRIKDIYVKAKDGAEHSVYSSECNSEESKILPTACKLRSAKARWT